MTQNNEFSAPAHEHQHLLAGWRFRALLITVLMSIIGYFLFTIWAGWEEVLNAAMQVGGKGIALALALSLLNYSLRFLRWRLFLGRLGHTIGDTIPWGKAAKIYLSGFALTPTPGKSGEAIRGVFLKDYNVPFRKSFAVFFAERISDLLSVGILAAAGAWIYPEARPVLLVVALLMALLFYALNNEKWMKALSAYARRTLPQKFALSVDYLLEVGVALRACFKGSPASILCAVGLGVVAWGAEAFALYIFLHLLGHAASLITAFYIYGFALVIGGITMLPGGLGGAEVAMLELLHLQGLQLSDAVALTLIIRLTTLWFSVFLGLLAFPKSKIIWSK